MINKKDIETYISSQTKSTITFEKYGLSFYPFLSLKLSSVNYDDKELANISTKELYLGFSLSSLLDFSNLKIDSVILNEPNIKIYSNTKPTNSKQEIIDIKYLELNNAKISYENYRFNALNLDASIENSIIKINKLHVKNWNEIKDITIEGNINLSKKEPFYNVNLKVQKSNPQYVLKEFKIIQEAVKSISLDANIKGDSKQLILHQSSLSINDSKLSIDATINNLDINDMQSDIRIDQLDLNQYLAPSKIKPSKKSSKKKINYESYFKDLRKVSHMGVLNITQLKVKDYHIKDLSLKLQIKKGMITISPSSFKLYDGELMGKYIIDIRKSIPKVTVQQNIKNIHLTKLINSKSNILKGNINLDTHFTFEGMSKKEIFASLKGEKKMWGKNIVIDQYNVDDILDKFEETKKVNLLDIGAIFLAGPFAGLFTQGTKFALLKSEVDKKGSTKVKEFLSVWTFKNNHAYAKDVALKTSKNILALKGSINLDNKKFDDITIAVLDKKKCAKFSQTLEGDLSKNEIGIKQSAAATFLSPISGIFESAGKLLGGCEKFYSGDLK